jgi:biopolymer transport protein ExbD
VAGDVNVIPFIDMLSVIIIFLIMVASFLNLGVVESSMPKAGESASVAQPEKKKEEKEKLNLTIAITDKGFYVGGAGAILQEKAGEPTIPKVDGKYDFKALNDKLWEIKQKYPDEWDVIILTIKL